MSWFDAVRDRWASLAHSEARDEELAEELRFHIETETSRLLAAGYDPQVAGLRALERLGDRAWIMEATHQQRGVDRIERIMHDIRSAFRSLRKQPGFTMLAVGTLGLGIGVTAAAFTVLHTVLLRPLPYRDAGSLVLLRERTDKGALASPSFPNFVDWRAQAHAFSGVASEMYPFGATVRAGTDPVRVTVMGVSRGFFSVLGVRPLLGREFTAGEEQLGGAPTVMVSWDFWATELHHRAELGTIRVGDQVTAVVGVLPPAFRFVDDADIYLPHEQFPGTCRTCHNYRVVARLAPGATMASAQTEMTTLSQGWHATYGVDTQAADVAVSSLREYLVGGYRPLLLVVFGAAALVLLIACTNLISAQLARGMSRAREIAVRAALGASRARLIRQLLAESAILAARGAVAGIAIAASLTAAVRELGAGLIRRLDELHVGGAVLLFTIGVSALAAVLFGALPALRSSNRNPAQLLRSARGSSGAVRGTVWRVLIGFEVATAMILLVGAALLVRTLHNILAADTGFRARHVVTASLVTGDTVSLAMTARLQQELGALPGVTGVAFTNHLPLDWSSTAGPVRRPGDPPDRNWPAMAGFRIVSADYFAVLEQPILRGRPFTAADVAGHGDVAIVTPGIARRLWPGDNPIGKTIASNYLMSSTPGGGEADDWLTVVGVAAEASSWTMARGDQDEIYVPLAQHPARGEGSLIALVHARDDPRSLIPSIRSALHQIVPELPPRLGTLDERIARSAADRRFAMMALTLFGGVALVLAGIGIFGTMSYIASTRTQEIGIRMALGATPGAVLRRALFDAGMTAVGGIALGCAGGAIATRYLQSALYGVGRVDPAAYGAGAAILLVTALLGAWIPAHRSSRVDPLRAIRAE